MAAKHWNIAFEEDFGVLLTEEISNDNPNNDLETEKDYFYYMLGLLQALIDNKPIPHPTSQMSEEMGEVALGAKEFLNFHKLALMLRIGEPQTHLVLSAAIMKKCLEVIENFERMKPLFEV